jgi:hypothetical protein
MRKILLLVFLLVYSLSLKAQETYTINEHGTYIVDSGAITKVPFGVSANDISIYGFWRNYAVFIFYELGDSMGVLLFNIDNKAVNYILDESFAVIPEIIEDDTYLCIMLGKWNNVSSIRKFDTKLELDYFIYKFDMKSLELVEETYVGKLFRRRRYLPTGEKITSNRINNNTVRYIHGNKYFDIIYDRGVDMRQWERFFVYYDNNLNRYAIFVNEYYDGK